MNDLIVSFGSVNHYNHNDLKKLVEVVKENVNKPIEVEVLRLEEQCKENIFYYNNKSY